MYTILLINSLSYENKYDYSNLCIVRIIKVNINCKFSNKAKPLQMQYILSIYFRVQKLPIFGGGATLHKVENS